MNDDRELEELLRASMKHHAEQMPEIDSVHTRRRRTPVLIAAAASVVVIAAGAVALTSLAPIFSAGSGTAASASTHLDLGGPRPLFSQEFSAGDGSSAAPTPAAAAEWAFRRRAHKCSASTARRAGASPARASAPRGS